MGMGCLNIFETLFKEFHYTMYFRQTIITTDNHYIAVQRTTELESGLGFSVGLGSGFGFGSKELKTVYAYSVRSSIHYSYQFRFVLNLPIIIFVFLSLPQFRIYQFLI